MRTVFDSLRALVYGVGFVLVWGWLALQVRPFDRSIPITLPAWAPVAGIVLLVVGGAVVLACVTGFVWWGAGTPAPFDPPRRFVARGPYRFVRNPMYIGGFVALLGYGLLLRSPAIMGLVLVAIGCLHLFVVLYEEPTLTRRFGEDYRHYRATVPRWLPRFVVMLLVGLSLGACGGGPVPSHPAAETRITEYRNGRWFDGNRFVDQTMYVVGDRFRAHRPRQVDTVVDLAGRWVVPPYGDAHQHLLEPARIATYVQLFLHDGVFYVKDQGTAPALRARFDSAVNVPSSFEYASANQAWTAPGTSRFQDHLDTNAVMLVNTPDDLAQRWSAFIERRPKPDHVALLLSYSEQHASRKDDRGIDPALVPNLVHRAHGAGLTVSAHVVTAADFRHAVAGGVDEVADVPGGSDLPVDAFRLTDADAEVAAGRRMTVVTALAKLAIDLRRDSAGTADRIRDVYAPNVEVLRRHGVRLLVGTDLIHQSAALELRVLGRLGLFSSLELLTMWSVTTPQAIFPRRKIGELADGYEASFLVLAGDPLQDFAHTQHIVLRVKQGRRLDIPETAPTFP